MEEVGLIVEFVEQNIRGSKDRLCIVKVTESAGVDVMDEWKFNSWEKLKAEYPDFKSLLKEIFTSDNWRAEWRDGDRVIYAKSIIGHEGLYEDIDSRVEWSEVYE